jgi:hypothetical protein
MAFEGFQNNIATTHELISSRRISGGDDYYQFKISGLLRH